MHLLLLSRDEQYGNSRSASKVGWGLALLFLLVMAVTLLMRTVYFVDETEYVYVTQFGRPVRLETQPGLAIKWPYQSLWRFDRRLRLYEPPAREMLTQDKENLNFQWFVCWRIAGPSFVLGQSTSDVRGAGQQAAETVTAHEQVQTYVQRFLESVGSKRDAESRLEERIQAALAAEIGRRRLDQLVNLTPEQVQLDEITRCVIQSIRQAAADEFGIEVVDIRIKRFNYPEAVKPAVYEEIRSERQRVAVQYRAEGASEKTKIESLAELERDQLLAEARRHAMTIRAEGEAKAMAISNAAHGKNPQFYQLLKTLEAYRTILDDQTTVVLAADSPLLKLLTRGLPDSSATPPDYAGVKPSHGEAETAEGEANLSGSVQPARVAEQKGGP